MSRDLDTSNWLAEKLSWANAATRDPALSHLAVRVAFLIMNDLNGVERCAFRGQDGIASLIGSNPRSVRTALAELIKAGYLRKQGRGRGNTNAYYATFPGAGTRETKGEPGSHDRQKSADHSSKNDKGEVAMTGGNPPPRPAEIRRQTLRTNPNPPYPPNADRAAPVSKSGSLPPPFREDVIRRAVVAVAGEEAAVSYLDAARWDQATKRIVCRGSIGHDRLRERAGKTLSGMGVGIILDASLWARLASPIEPVQEAA